MNKSELIKRMCDKLDQLTSRDVDLAVQTIIDTMSESLAGGERIEIRGFGTLKAADPVAAGTIFGGVVCLKTLTAVALKLASLVADALLAVAIAVFLTSLLAVDITPATPVISGGSD